MCVSSLNDLGYVPELYTGVVIVLQRCTFGRMMFRRTFALLVMRGFSTVLFSTFSMTILHICNY